MQALSEKARLRAMLDAKVQEKLVLDPGAVTTYAAEPDPERKPYKKRASIRDISFRQELEKMQAEVESGQSASKEPRRASAGLSLDDYPGLAKL